MDLLRHLDLFNAVAETGSFARAAEKIGIAQPPMSQAIKRLEAELGCRLFDRTPRGAELTRVGLMVREEARRLRSDVDRLRSISRFQQAPPLDVFVDTGFPENWAYHISKYAADANTPIRMTPMSTEEALIKARSQGALALVLAPVRTEQLRTSSPLRSSLWETYPNSLTGVLSTAFVHPNPPSAALRVAQRELCARGLVGDFMPMNKLTACAELSAGRLNRVVTIGPPDWIHTLPLPVSVCEIPPTEAGAVFQLVMRRDTRDRDKLAAWKIVQACLMGLRNG